ncbi:class III signal peptide-containing protein [Candidatus Micrarchaeota archaeon]|nr:class III signal peptide-containing protein [Candidatus Micrarchaeota archaeon]
MKRAQGSLEYLIIIAAVLIVAGMVVYFLSSAAGGGKSAAVFSACQKAATTCFSKHVLNPTDPCNFCADQCADPSSGEEIFVNVTACCRAGNASGIYEGSPGC